MGMLKHLLFWPVTGPAFLTRFTLEKVQGVVTGELTDDAPVKEALLELQLRLELGEIDEDTYEREEARLMEDLREVRRRREEHGLGARGGVVGFAQGEGGDGPDEARDPAVPGGAALEISVGWGDEGGDREDRR